MRLLALASIVVSLCAVPAGAQPSDPHLARAVERIDRNDLDGLRRLLAADPSLVRRTGAGVLPHWLWTLLHDATAGKASPELVGALIDAGADVNARDNEGNTPLHFSVKRINREKLSRRDYEGIVRLLLEKKADVHNVNIGGATPLHTAAAFRADPSVVEMLIRAGADVNVKALASYGGWTPLHGAAARNSGGVVAVLLKHGADPTATDARGLTALQVAEQGGFEEAAKVLRGNGAGRAGNRAGRASSIARGLGVAGNARYFAMLTTASADALTACRDAKYFYNLWRPATAIRAGDSDGHAAAARIRPGLASSSRPRGRRSELV